MRSLVEAYTQNGVLHHAYLIEGDSSKNILALFSFLEKELGVSVKGNPDLWHKVFDTFGIDDGRVLKSLYGTSAVTDGKRFFVIETSFFTHEAQNALLKMFEEPPRGTHFFLLVPNADIVLPTLRSRFFVVESGTTEIGNASEIKDFTDASLAKRLAYVQKIIDEKDKEKAIEFLNALEVLFEERLRVHPDKQVGDFLKDIQKMRRYLYGRAPSLKMILEYIALTLPV